MQDRLSAYQEAKNALKGELDDVRSQLRVLQSREAAIVGILGPDAQSKRGRPRGSKNSPKNQEQSE